MLGSYRWAWLTLTEGSRTFNLGCHRNHEFELGTSYAHGASSWSALVSLRSSGSRPRRLLAMVPIEIHRTGRSDLVPLQRRSTTPDRTAALRTDRCGLAQGELGG